VGADSVCGLQGQDEEDGMGQKGPLRLRIVWEAAERVGLVPWVPLMHFQGAPALILEGRSAGGVFEKTGSSGGKRLMMESQLIREIVAENTQKARQEDILEFLQARFGAVPDEIARRLRQVRAQKKLKALIQLAGRSPDLETFQRQL